MRPLNSHHDPRLEFRYPDSTTLEIILMADWHLRDGPPSAGLLEQALAEFPQLKQVRLINRPVTSWDTSLPVFITRLTRFCAEAGLPLDSTDLPDGVQQLLNMANAIPPAAVSARLASQAGIFEQIGIMTLNLWQGLPHNMRFIGEIIMSFVRLAGGKAQFRPNDLLLLIQQVGPNALPIVSLVSFLVGLILAYMGAVQLERVGVQIYIADLVSIAMVREVGALMTGIIMAGRTGAAFAAELGTMQVNEEIDAFKTLGISTIDFLVMPRVLALLLMIPLLTLYSGLVGTLAGMVVGISVFDITLFEYWQQTIQALELKQFWVGIFKGCVYGIVVAIAGCLRGIQCGRSAQAVGEATTSAVVTSIVFIVITASAMTIVFYKLDI
jgi:phospholipid/cholesterol/gamma-HCH transport system permease protein